MTRLFGAGRHFQARDGCVGHFLGVATIMAGILTAAAAPVSASSPAAPQLVAPVIGKVEQSATHWREGPNLPQISSRHRRGHTPPVGTTFTFTLSEEASVTLRFTQRNAGRIVGGQCVHQTHQNRVGHKACRHLTQGVGIGLVGHSGKDTVDFDGQYSTNPSRSLVPGAYTLTVWAYVFRPSESVTERSVVLKSATRTLHFTIVR